MKTPPDEQHPETYNGVVAGAALMLVALLWFTLPMLITGRFLWYPWILFALGALTIVRHAQARK